MNSYIPLVIKEFKNVLTHKQELNFNSANFYKWLIMLFNVMNVTQTINQLLSMIEENIRNFIENKVLLER